MNKKSSKIIAWLLALLYTGAMLYLLFLIRYFSQGMATLYTDTSSGYLRAVMSNVNLVPFRTIKMYLRQTVMFSPNDFAFTNLAGNVIMFIPYGIFLPMLFPKQRNFFRFLGTSVLTILMVELMQGITLLGSCDIDDFILNMAGILIGFILFCIFRPKKKPVSA